MDLPRVEVFSRADWRNWLAAHHTASGSIWLVKMKKGQPGYVPPMDLVAGAFCFGWVDSLPRKLDARRSLLLFSARRPGSAWSKVNKDLVARLRAAGRMAPAGEAAVAAAQADGSWSALDAVERLEEPADLVAALDATPGARAFWDRFPPSSRRGILEWINAARRAETRTRRVADTARLAAANRKANHPAGRDRGPAPPV
ncbi:MAG: YdeI/OmpD-associated family protein [Pseudomonadota bacterium]